MVVGDVVATWGDVDENLNFTSGKMLKGVGGLANFMQHPIHGKTRFFSLIVLPLILLFVIYAFILVRTLIIAKLEKEKKVAGETAISVDAMTEEEKQALIAQLLASQKSEADVADSTAESVENVENSESGEIATEVENAESEGSAAPEQKVDVIGDGIDADKAE